MAALLSVLAAIALASRYLPISSTPGVFFVSICPYLLLGVVPAAVLFCLTKRWICAAAAGAIAIAAVTAYAPWYLSARTVAGGDSVTVRILTANLRRGTTDSAGLVAIARARADVLAVQELTPPQARKLRQAGLGEAFSSQSAHPAPKSLGVGLWSRFRIDDASLLTSYPQPFLRVRLAVPGVSAPLSVLVVHVSNSVSRSFDEWRSDLARLGDEMNSDVHKGSGCVVVAGDFNSTIDMREYRELMRNGFEDAADQVGAGVLPTFPADSSIPPLLGIDHVLVRGCQATSVEAIRMPGSDHLAVVASIRVPV